MLIDVTTDIKDYFGDLIGGDTFYYPQSRCMWMKLNSESARAVEDLEDVEFNYNAVSLDDGTLAEFYNSEQVIAIKTKLVNA